LRTKNRQEHNNRQEQNNRQEHNNREELTTKLRRNPHVETGIQSIGRAVCAT
jgi:hypothetical protein